MKFAQPIWLFVGLIACAALLWRYRRFDARQRAELKRFASESLIAQLTGSVSGARRQFKRALVVAGIACAAIALARPLAGFHWEETKRKGLDLLFAVDTSKSMLAQDVRPDRLTRAKMAVEDLLGHLEGDRVGLIAFAGNAFLQCPLTLDYDAFRQSLDAVDTRIIPRGGTDIASAIHEAGAALEGQGHNERILVLLTDGEDLEGSALEAARAAGEQGLKIFTVGVGSANGE
jgi:Ca-activated chloride channel family protein